MHHAARMQADADSGKNIHRVLFAGAFGPEIEQLADYLNDSSVFRQGRLQCSAIALGVGSLEAALNLYDHFQTQGKPDEVILLGSAGAYQTNTARPCRDLQIGDFCQASAFHQRDLAVIQNQAKSIELSPAFCKPGTGSLARALQTGLADLIEVQINSTASITSVETRWAPTEENIQLPCAENLEAFGVARLCERLDIPMNAILAITNPVGPLGSADWQCHFKSLGNKLQLNIINYLNNFSPDLISGPHAI